MSKAIPLRVAVTAQNYSHLNSPEMVNLACSEHTIYSPSDFAPGTGLYVLPIESVRYDFGEMTHQPRIENKNPNKVKQYKNSAINGVEVNGKLVFGIREAGTVYSSQTRKYKFEGILAHHRFAAAKDAGFKTFVAFIDDNFPLLPLHEQIDYTMRDNAGVNNQLENSAASCLNSLKATLRCPHFKPHEKTQKKLLLEKLATAKASDDEPLIELIQKKLKKLNAVIRKPLTEKTARWMPSHTPQYWAGLVTQAMNDWNTGFVGLHSHTKQERIEVVLDLGLSSSTSFHWGQKSQKNNVQINLPIAEFVKRCGKYLRSNGEYPKEFHFVTNIPVGARDYSHLMELRQRTATSLMEALDFTINPPGAEKPHTKLKFHFLGQILKSNDWKEDPKKVYDLDYVNRFIASQ